MRVTIRNAGHMSIAYNQSNFSAFDFLKNLF